jgi:hypothetical protein
MSTQQNEAVMEQLQDVKFPLIQDGPMASTWNVIQARKDGIWVREWIIVDNDGAIIAAFSLPEDEEITAQDVARVAYNLVREIHGLSYDDIGIEGEIVQLVVVREDES